MKKCYHVTGEISSGVAVRGEGSAAGEEGLVGEERLVGEPKFHPLGMFTMKPTNIHSD